MKSQRPRKHYQRLELKGSLEAVRMAGGCGVSVWEDDTVLRWTGQRPHSSVTALSAAGLPPETAQAVSFVSRMLPHQERQQLE